MKNLLICTLVASFFIPLMGKTEEMSLPVIKKPIALEEGTQRELSASQIAELLPWARDSKIYLQDLLSGVKGLPSADKLDRLVEGVKEVVGESAPKNSELLMRYILNRGLVVNTILSNEMDEIAVGSIDAKIRVIVSSINLAIKYYDIDMATLSKKAQASYVQFGWDYFQFLTEINKSIFDASAQYVIERTSLEWLQWDLYRDLNNTAQASKIVKINNSLRIYPTKKMSDGQSIAYIRQMKSLIAQLLGNDIQAQTIEPFKKLETKRGDIINELKSNIKTATGLAFTVNSSVHGVCILNAVEFSCRT